MTPIYLGLLGILVSSQHQIFQMMSPTPLYAGTSEAVESKESGNMFPLVLQP